MLNNDNLWTLKGFLAQNIFLSASALLLSFYYYFVLDAITAFHFKQHQHSSKRKKSLLPSGEVKVVRSLLSSNIQGHSDNICTYGCAYLKNFKYVYYTLTKLFYALLLHMTTELFLRQTKRWSIHQLNSIHTEVTLEFINTSNRSSPKPLWNSNLKTKTKTQ